MDFQTEVIERSANEPVVVDFWAAWCGPCHALTPILERETAARELALVKVNVDEEPALAAEYGIRDIPAVKAFRNGHVVDEFVGARSPQSVASFLDALSGESEAERLVEELRVEGEWPEVVEALDAGDVERALEWLLAQVGRGDRERIRRLMVALFADLGPEHPLTLAYRRRLASALY